MPTLDQPRARDLAAPQPGVPAEVLTARAYLSAVAEPPAPALARLVAELGPIDAADRVARRAVPDSVAAETTRAAVHRSPVDLAQAAAEGIQLLTPEHDSWPHHRFADLAALAVNRQEFTPPLALWVRGTASLAGLTRHWVAVLGARAATSCRATVERQRFGDTEMTVAPCRATVERQWFGAIT